MTADIVPPGQMAGGIEEEWNEERFGYLTGLAKREIAVSGVGSHTPRRLVVPAHTVTLERRRHGAGGYRVVDHAVHRTHPAVR
jgi:hypothetical protein